MRWSVAFALLVAMPLAGCLDTGTAGLSDGPSVEAAPPVFLRMGEALAVGTDPLRWNGSAATMASEFPFEVALPDGFWSGHAGALEVSILWDRFVETEAYVAILDGDGAVVAEGVNAPPFVDHGVGSVALLPEAPPGAYRARVWTDEGAVRVEGVVQLEARRRDAPARDLLPNLVPLAPTHLNFERPEGGYDPPFPAEPARDALTGDSCYVVNEGVEQRARRCLRFSTGVGNAGDGSLELRVDWPNMVTANAGAGHATQRVYATDGSFRETDAGAATFHAAHKHVHYDGFVEFVVYDHDLATGERGEPRTAGRKGGMCFGDEGVLALGLNGTAGRLYGWDGCFEYTYLVGADALDPATIAAGNTMGLSPGWYDEYDTWQSDQYVDVSDLADGVYEVVFTLDQAGTLVESDETDNEASTVFRLTGDTVEELAHRGGW